MTGPITNSGAQGLISALSRFITVVLQGKVPMSIRPFFFGASLTALTKKEGGIRPIAVGCTLRRLAAKVAGFRVRDKMAALLAPRQLGYGAGLAAPVRHEAGLQECLQNYTQRQNASGSAEPRAGSAPFCPRFLLITLLPLLE